MEDNNNNNNNTEISIEQEIDKVIDEMSDKKDETVAPVSEGAPETVAEPVAEPAAQEAFAADDALVERGVKAGLSVSDVKAFANKEMAERILSALESGSAPATEEKANGTEEQVVAGTPDDEIPDLPDDGDYDPKIVELFKAMKSVIGKQSKELASLKSAGEAAAKQTFFDRQYDGLDDAVRSHVDAVRKSQLKSKFDMLEAGYKAVNANVKREDVFREAVSLAIGDLVQQAKSEGKADQLAKRRTLALARPGGESGQRSGKSADPIGDVVADIAKEFKLNLY